MTDERFEEIKAHVEHQKCLGIFNGKEAEYLDELIALKEQQEGDPGWTPEQCGDIADLTVEFLDLKRPGKPKAEERSIPGLPEGMQIKRIYERHGIGIMCELEPKSFTCTKI